MEQMIETLNVLLFSVGVYMLAYRDYGRFNLTKTWNPMQQWNQRNSVEKREWIIKKVTDSHVCQPFVSLWQRFSAEQKEQEIYEGISYLRNLVNVGNGYHVNGDYILEELAQLGGSMQRHYIQMLHFVRSNECEKGLNRFLKEVGTESAAEYGRILIQWDRVEPEALAEMLQLYQCSIQERRITLKKHRDEVYSDLIYLPVVMNVMILLINFVYVAYFLDQKRMLLTMFQ